MHVCVHRLEGLSMHAPMQAIGHACTVAGSRSGCSDRPCTRSGARSVHGRCDSGDARTVGLLGPSVHHAFVRSTGGARLGPGPPVCHPNRTVRLLGPPVCRPSPGWHTGGPSCSDRPLQLTVRTNIGSVNQLSGWLTDGPKPRTAN